MPVHDFSDPTPPGAPPPVQQEGPHDAPVRSQVSDSTGGRIRMDWSPQEIGHEVQEFLIPGFRSLDEAIRRYWSGMRVPTKDGYRFMRVKVAGGDRNLLIWRDELVGGRARLPVGAIDRTGFEFNAEKYSPASLPMAIKYPSRRGDRAIKVFRPVPYLVDYKLVVWTERKRDVEFILMQVLQRFTPLAEFRLFDGRLQGTVVLKYGSGQDTSDKEVGYDQPANVRYEFSMTAEAWVPLPEVSVPTVLGTVRTLREQSGEVLLRQFGSSGPLW